LSEKRILSKVLSVAWVVLVGLDPTDVLHSPVAPFLEALFQKQIEITVIKVIKSSERL